MRIKLLCSQSSLGDGYATLSFQVQGVDPLIYASGNFGVTIPNAEIPNYMVGKFYDLNLQEVAPTEAPEVAQAPEETPAPETAPE
jgi:hypothetical protein